MTLSDFLRIQSVSFCIASLLRRLIAETGRKQSSSISIIGSMIEKAVPPVFISLSKTTSFVSGLDPAFSANVSDETSALVPSGR